MTDEDLIESVQEGNETAFEELVEKYQERVMRICYGMLSDYDEACDAAQNAFVKIYFAIPNFRGECSVYTWLYRIVQNACYDALRKKREQFYSLEQILEEGEGQLPRQESNQPENLIEKKETQRLIRKAINELDHNSKWILTLYDLDGKSYEEIAAILMMPIGTVKSRLSRARAKLRKILWEKREQF